MPVSKKNSTTTENVRSKHTFGVLCMELLLDLAPCAAGAILPILKRMAVSPCACHTCDGPPYMPPIPVGTKLVAEMAELRVVGQARIPVPASGSWRETQAPLVEALRSIPDTVKVNVRLEKKGLSLAWVTLSDSGSRGMRTDTSGPAIEDYLKSVLPLTYVRGTLLPDDPNALRACLTDYALIEQFDIIVTTGGTGLTARDLTPETTEKVIDSALPGFVIAMMKKSLEATPRAVLSRAQAGILGQSLIINLPGSRKAVLENLEAIAQALEHTVEKLHNDPSDCGR